MIKYEKILQRIGLSERESQIYIDLLDHPISRMVDISRRTNIHRPALYLLLPLLRERGLISIKMKGKQAFYHAASPKVLDDILDDMVQKFKQTIPELQSIYDAKGNHVHVQYYDGIPGIQKIYEEIAQIVPEHGEYFAYTGRSGKADPQYFTEKFWKLRDEKKLTRYIIASAERVSEMTKKPYQEIVAIPSHLSRGIFERNMVKIIYHNRVAIIDFSLQTGVVIENAVFAMMEQSTFMLLFRFLKNT